MGEGTDPIGAALVVLAGIAWGAWSLRGRRSVAPLATTARNFALAVRLAAIVAALSLRSDRDAALGRAALSSALTLAHPLSMRFLQLVIASMSGPPDPEHRAKAGAAIREKIASGALLATGGLGKRATAGARVIKKNGEITVEDPPNGAEWMAAGGYSVAEYASKADAIEAAKETLAFMGDAVLELISVSEMHPAPKSLPLGVIPYLSLDGASEASELYQRAFAAREIARMPAQDGKRLMHCQLEINGGALMLSDHFPEMGAPPVQRSPSYTMQLVVADGDAWWNRAIAAGCKEKMPFAIAPWGDKYGQMVDPFGVTWAISSPAK